MNEIITYGKGYKLTPGIKVFIKSAKEVCKHVTILSSNLGDDIKQYCKQRDVNFYDVSEIAKKYNVDETVSPYTLKVVYFYLYCKFVSNADNVYACDFTDTYFQKNVFNLITNNKPYVTTENFPINRCDTNQTWFRVCYNNDILNLLSKYDVINGGNIFGNRISVTELLKEMCTDLSLIMGRAGNYQNIDQACLNKVVRFDQHRYNILDNFEVFNLAHYGDARLQLIDRNITLNEHVPHVIHQYDVIKSLEKFLYEKYN